MQAVATHSAAPAVTIYNGIPTVLSTNIADVFGKRHDHVLRDIESILKTTPEERLNNFIKIDIEKPANLGNGVVKYRAYALTKEGFTFLAMGFTGTKAAQFKWAYIDEFKRMEEALRNPPKPEYISVEHRWAIQKAVGRKARGQSVNYQTVYRALKDHFKVEKYTHILEADFDAAIAFIESLPPMQLPPLNAPAPRQLSAAPQKEPRKFLVDEKYLERQRTFIYNWRYLYKDSLELILELLYRMQSPLAPALWEAIHDMYLWKAERDLAKLGYDVKELDCYKSWASHQPKRLTA